MSEERKPFSSRFSRPILILIAILAFGGFLRLYHFSDWLHFELDQARDARVIDEALSGGPGELTLLGMKAGGTSLRLGPGFYYLEYLSGLVFGATPQGIAMIIPILSVASIGVFYLFARRFFGVSVSLALALLFSVSEYLVMYGRFAWNPNPLPFFSLLGFYALLRSVSPDERRPGRWFVLSAFSIGLATHLHFLAFLSLPVVAAIFLLVRRPRFSSKAWAAAFAAFIVFYVPVVLNEIETGGANSRAFLSAITEKSSKTTRTAPEKLIRNITEHGLGYLTILTGIEDGGFADVDLRREGVFRIECDARCQDGKVVGSVSMAAFALSLISAFYLWFRIRDRRQSDVLLLSGIWFLVVFSVLFPLAYGFSPRFFLAAAPIPFLLLGFLLEGARAVFPGRKSVMWVGAAILAIFVALNVFGVAERFRQSSLALTEAVDTPADRILKEKIRVPLEQQMKIVDYLKTRSDERGWPVYMHSEPEHRRALKYLLERRGVENAGFGLTGIYEEGIYVLILRSKSDLYDGMKKYLEKYDVVEKHSFGTLTMIEFRPKETSIEAKRQVFVPQGKVQDNPTALPRYTWREWWERKNDPGNDEEE
ncbi:MAG: glycosyltransferase family 39 protein [Candidatus Moranbacteria bacterium]|nr:glycosyltransferase family 39 protein [Candidatus Moranbacteria bacterium]